VRSIEINISAFDIIVEKHKEKKRKETQVNTRVVWEGLD
jgi:hypothetical protein